LKDSTGANKIYQRENASRNPTNRKRKANIAFLCWYSKDIEPDFAVILFSSNFIV
jgi:hypothetical protein